MFVDVVHVVDSIRKGSLEVSQASDDLSHRTESQATTLEETAAALEELTRAVQMAVDGSREAEQTPNEARDEVEASGTIVENAAVAMRDIEQSFTQISQIIGVIDDIDDIAFQTNLLALKRCALASRVADLRLWHRKSAVCRNAPVMLRGRSNL